MRLLFAGTPTVALPSLAALLASKHEVVGVLTRPDAPVGRSKTPVPSPVKAAAEEAGIEVFTLPAKSAELATTLQKLDLDAAAVVAYGALLPPQLLTIPRYGWINLHFSLLPAWRGAAPVQAALLAGDDITGACTFQIEEGLDTGPVFGSLTETIRPTDTAGDLLDRLATAGSRLMVDTMSGIADGILSPVAQVGEPTYAPRLVRDDARVRWTHPAQAVDRRVRACTPNPGAWTELSGKRIGLGPVRPTSQSGLAPGEIAATKRTVLVGTATHAVELGPVTPAGRKQMAAADWARGNQVDGLRFDDYPGTTE